MTGWPAVTRSHQRAEAEPAGAGRCHVPALKTQDGVISPGGWGLWELDEARKVSPRRNQSPGDPPWTSGRRRHGACCVCSKHGFSVIC